MLTASPHTWLLATILMIAAGCQSAPTRAPASAVNLQSYQAREVETSKRIAFAATMSVFQDLGFIIDDGDFDTGLITASGPTEKPKSAPALLEILLGTELPVSTVRRRATAFVEIMPSKKIRIRLNFVDAFTVGMNNAPTSTPVEDPAVYQDTFARIDQAVFLRRAME